MLNGHAIIIVYVSNYIFFFTLPNICYHDGKLQLHNIIAMKIKKKDLIM